MWSAKQWACQRTAEELDSSRKQRKNWMSVSLSANLFSWLTSAMHSWSSWLPTPSPVVSTCHTGRQQPPWMLDNFTYAVDIQVEMQIYCRGKYYLDKKKKIDHWPTIFVFLLVLLLALFTGRLALWGLRCSRLSSATRAASWKWWSGAGQHLAATKGTGQQLQEHWRNTLIYQETDLEQEIQNRWTHTTQGTRAEKTHNINDHKDFKWSKKCFI